METSGTDHGLLISSAITLHPKDCLMPRRARLGLLGIPWHIIQRGNNRSVCFFAEKDHRL
jgi:hypothetical protein